MNACWTHGMHFACTRVIVAHCFQNCLLEMSGGREKKNTHQQQLFGSQIMITW